ncbi:MAG TPA: lasso peptide biosynthesis B2 protein [Desulfuromonadaceae bacterium]
MAKWLKSLRDAPAKWRRRSRVERQLLLEAFALLGVARLLVLTIPFRWLTGSLGKRMNESGTQIAESDMDLARLIGQAIRSAANNTPWKSVCLPQAVAGQWMLKRRRIPATLYLGVAKDDAKTEKLAAHAWLRCGEIVLTGASGHRQFTVVATFS